MIIRTAELALSVTDGVALQRALEKIASDFGGYVADSREQSSEGIIHGGSMELHVPADRLDAVLMEVRSHGRLLSESAHGEDITEKSIDLDARLANARMVESRLLQLLSKQTAQLSDVLQVESKLGEVREEIERFEASRRLWDTQVAMATVTLRFSVTLPHPAPAFVQELHSTLVESLQALLGLFKTLLFVLTALLPWLPFLMALSMLSRWFVRRSRAAAGLGG
jgi:hypothetical protein